MQQALLCKSFHAYFWLSNMNYRQFSGFVILILSTQLASASALRGVNAGVIPWTCLGSEAFVLLAYDPWFTRRGWAAFGGGPVNETEPVHRTAMREFHEETRCVYYSPDSLVLENQPFVAAENFYSYVLRVEYVEPAVIENHHCPTPRERAQWLWVYLPELREFIDAGDAERMLRIAPSGHRQINIWEAAARTLEQAFAEGLLPVDEVCAVGDS